MNPFPHLKLRKKLGVGFGGLILLIGLNAVIVIITIFITSRHVDTQLETADLLSELNQISNAAGRYAQVPSRELANEIFVTLDAIRQQAAQAAQNIPGLEALQPLLDDYRAQFHKFVVQADQRSSLRSHTNVLKRRIDRGVRDVVAHATEPREMFTARALFDFVIEIHDPEYEIQTRRHPDSFAPTRDRLAVLRESALAGIRSPEKQREIFGVLLNVGDYLNTLEKFLAAERAGQRTAIALSDLSKQLEMFTARVDMAAQGAVRRQLYSAGALMAAFFLVSIAGAVFLAGLLTREILRPIHTLLGTIRTIGAGSIDCRAAVETRDEIGELAQAFNGMADSLQRSHETLEQQVIERTRQLSESERRFRDIVDTTDGIVWEADAHDFTFTFVSKKAESILGIPVEEWYAPGFWMDHLHPDDRTKVPEQCAEHIARSEPHRLDYRLIAGDGHSVWIQDIVAVVEENGRPRWLRGIMLDITESKRKAADYDRVTQDYQTLFREMLNGFALHEIICDAAGTPVDYRFLAVNPAFERLIGLSANALVGHTAREAFPGIELSSISIYGTVALSGEPVFFEKHSDVIDKHFEVMAFRPAPGQFACIIQDVTERKRSEATIRNLAFFDQLTGLPNRASLKERLGQSLASAERHRNRAAIMVIDLDNFKAINDTLGHPTGDKLLAEVARRLEACVRHSDLVARLGGDEFVVVLPEIEQPADAATVGDKIVTSVSAPYHIDGQELRTSPSIGICLYPDDSSTPEDLLKKADVAMYQAKAGGKCAYQFFRLDFQQAVERRQALEADLRRALEEKQFVLHYQPQYDLRTGRLCGVEALVRWQHPQRGLVPPAEFIPVTEETGMIMPLGGWILQEACRQMSAWRAGGVEDVLLSVNLSVAQFNDPALPEHVAAALAKSGLPAHCLNLEITESMAMASPEAAEAMIRKIADSGATFSIDDFGTGYSSLAYLKQFPIRGIKIDRSFVKEIETDGNAADICEVSVMLAHRLGLEVMAEGVETRPQSDFLRRVGCEKIQGFLVSRPLPAEQVDVFLRSFLFADCK